MFKRFRKLVARGAFALRKGWRNKSMRTIQHVTMEYGEGLRKFGHLERQILDLHSRADKLRKAKAEQLEVLAELETEAAKLGGRERQRAKQKAERDERPALPAPEAEAPKAA